MVVIAAPDKPTIKDNPKFALLISVGPHAAPHKLLVDPYTVAASAFAQLVVVNPKFVPVATPDAFISLTVLSFVQLFVAL